MTANPFVSFLKKFGQDVVKAGKAVLGVPTIVINEAKDIPQAVSDVKTLVDIVKMAEAMFAAAGQAKSGSAKLAAASPYVSNIVQDVELIDGKKIGNMIQDVAGFNEGISELTSGLVKCLNACGE